MNTRQTNTTDLTRPRETARTSLTVNVSARSSGQSVCIRGALTVLFVAALVMTMSTADARWYKWVDEGGNISYQDHPPPPTYDESTQVLNAQGVTVKRIPSREEQKRMDAEKEILAAKNQRDEMLIKAFPAEEDLTRTRDKRLGHIDGTVTRMHDQLVILNSRLVLIEDKIKNRHKHGLKPNPALESDRVAVIRSIDSTNALIKSKLKERRQAAVKFEADLLRYRELIIGAQNASLEE